jgi:hypothetical protein
MSIVIVVVATAHHEAAKGTKITKACFITVFVCFVFFVFFVLREEPSLG